MGEFPSGQRGQTVNLLAMPSVVRIHLPPPYLDVSMENMLASTFFFFFFFISVVLSYFAPVLLYSGASQKISLHQNSVFTFFETTFFGARRIQGGRQFTVFFQRRPPCTSFERHIPIKSRRHAVNNGSSTALMCYL